MIEVPINGKAGVGLTAVIDDEDYDKVKTIKWYNVHGYARSRSGVSMHRLILNAPDGLVVDHRNHNRMDNRKSNLRVCTQKENAKNTKHGKGYYWSSRHNRWVVRWGDRSKDTNKWSESRWYRTEEEAKRAVKLLRSGVELPRKDKKNRAIHYPHHVVRNRNNGYGVVIVRHNQKMQRWGFSKICDAVAYRDKLLKELEAV